MRERLRALWLIIGFAFDADRGRAVWTFVAMTLEALTRVSWPYWLKLLTDGVVQADRGLVWIAAAGYGGCLAALGLLNIARNRALQTLQEKTSHLIDQRLIQLSTGISTLEHHERPDFQDNMALLRQQRGQLGGTINALAFNLQMVVMFIGSFTLLSTVHPLLMALPLFGIPSLFCSAMSTRIHTRAQEEVAENTRRVRHLFGVSTAPEAGKEIRVFGLGPTLVQAVGEDWGIQEETIRRASLRAAAITSIGWLVFGIGYVLAMIVVISSTVHGGADVTIGDAVMALSLGAQVNGLVGGIAQMVHWLGMTLKTVGRFLWLERFAAERAPQGATAPVPLSIRDGITLESVTFRYPGTEQVVLEDISITLPAGSTVALVGENGAGKTTLVKLLCRFYDPDEGRIVVDDVPLNRIDPLAWRSALSSGFQDFARFEFLASETVGVGDLSRLDVTPAVNVALERAHATDVVPTLPSGLATQLGKRFDDGVELSTGQWQKLALARGMMRDAPLLLILDEPTASLDAETEHALFERFAGAARRAAVENGAVTVLVSHRFSTVRMADRIIVMDGGRIVEQGTHAELMRNDQLYADLYTLQANAYR